MGCCKFNNQEAHLEVIQILGQLEKFQNLWEVEVENKAKRKQELVEQPRAAGGGFDIDTKYRQESSKNLETKQFP